MSNLITVNGVRGYVDIEGTAHLNLEDAARGLGFVQRKGSVNYVRWDRVNSYLREMGFPQLVGKDCIPENVFYRLAMKGETETALEFQAKVADEILPSIRKHGGYLTSNKLEEVLLNPDTLIQLANNLKDERAKREQLQLQVERDKPKVIFAEALETSKDSILVADMSKLLKQNGVEIGEKRLFEWLRQNGYLIKGGSERNMPTQRSMELEIMEIKVGQRLSISEGSKVTRTPKITGKGQMYFINKFKAV